MLNLLGLLLVYLVRNTTYYITMAGVSLLLFFLVYRLIKFIDQIHSDINRFIAAVKTRDHTLNFQQKQARGSFPQLYRSFDEILKVHKSIELEQESLFQLLKTILEQVASGIIVVTRDEQKGKEIVFFNQAAQNMLRIPAYRYWHRLEQHLPEFGRLVNRLEEGGKQFLELSLGERKVQLAFSVTPLLLQQQAYTIITFQNIRDEIEQKEIEAWNKLIQVISHELLNSITPISSLSNTLQEIMGVSEELDRDAIEDIRLAIQTIHKRSVGLMEFVKDYRLMAELPTPELKPYTISELLNHVRRLMQPMVNARSVKLEVSQTLSKTTLPVDLKLIEQVLINLITNSLYALEGTPEPCIKINHTLEDGKLIVQVSDNGKGIPAADTEKVFIPFYTTREGGSGIGLTISRNIMKLHKGSILVRSVEGNGTEISLVFPYSSN
ncbi:MAG TPA: ATP-binding protein [Sphingobacteriaceae bacterium]